MQVKESRNTSNHEMFDFARNREIFFREIFPAIRYTVI